MKKILLFALPVLLMAGCGPTTYEYTDDIVGTWSLKSFKYQDVLYPVGDAAAENGFEGEFTWQFKDDGTYTANSTVAPVEPDDFDESLPFRDTGEFKGYYLVHAPNGFVIREEYRGPTYFRAFNINGSDMVCEYTPVGSKDNVTLTLIKK